MKSIRTSRSAFNEGAYGSRRNTRRGKILIELALVMPLIAMIGLGVGEYGYFIFAKSVIQEAAVAGARAAVESSATDASVSSAISAEMTANGFGSMGYTVTTSPPSVVTIATGTATAVTVSCSWGAFNVRVLPSGYGGIPASKMLTATVTMTRE